jgi:S-DNA-T family DNA segregation ATPase FtsK/SpoIIIE
LLDSLLDRYYLMRYRAEGNRNRSERDQVFQVQQKKLEKRKPVKIEPVVEHIEPSVRVEKEKQIPLFKTTSKGNSTIPPLALLDKPKPKVAGYSKSALEAMSQQLELKLLDFGIEIQVESVPGCRNYSGQVGDGTRNSERESGAGGTQRDHPVEKLRPGCLAVDARPG